MAKKKPPAKAGLLAPGESLQQKQKDFVNAYIACKFNATQAFKDAGYAAKTEGAANVGAHKLMTNPRVAEYLAHRLNEALDRNQIEVSKDRVVRELNRVAFSHIGQIMTWSTNPDTGEVALTVRDSAELTPEELATIKKIKLTRKVHRTKDGDEYSTTTMELEQHSKIGALEILAHAANLLTPDKGGVPNVMMNFFFGGQQQAAEKTVNGRALEHGG